MTEKQIDKMIATLIRLHVEGVLSEGQTVTATGLSRIKVRELTDDYMEKHL